MTDVKSARLKGSLSSLPLRRYPLTRDTKIQIEPPYAANFFACNCRAMKALICS
jgi:hypothetical protein